MVTETDARLKLIRPGLSLASAWPALGNAASHKMKSTLNLNYFVASCVVRDLKRWSYDMHAMQEMLNAT